MRKSKPTTPQTHPQTHSRLGASSAHRWMACPGSIQISEGLESSSSVFADTGTMLHAKTAEVIQARLEGRRFTNALDGLSFEQVSAVETCVDYVFEHFSPDEGDKLLIETQFELRTVHAQAGGTCDAVILYPRLRKLRVIDFKFGSGIPVEVENNPQLLFYALGAMATSKVEVDEIEIVIIQPLCSHPDGPIRSQKLEAFDLWAFEAELKLAAAETDDPTAPRNPGSHCRFCPAAAICPEKLATAKAVAIAQFSEAEKYSPKKLAEVLEWLPTLEAWIENVRSFAYEEVATRGKKIPGFKLVEKRATRKWRDEKEIAELFRRDFPLVEGLFEPETPRSPAQVEKILHKRQHDKLNEFIVAKSSGNTLVPVSDKRPAVEILDATTQFELDELF